MGSQKSWTWLCMHPYMQVPKESGNGVGEWSGLRWERQAGARPCAPSPHRQYPKLLLEPTGCWGVKWLPQDHSEPELSKSPGLLGHDRITCISAPSPRLGNEWSDVNGLWQHPLEWVPRLTLVWNVPCCRGSWVNPGARSGLLPVFIRPMSWNNFYIFIYLKKKIKRRIIFWDMEDCMTFKLVSTQFYWTRAMLTCFRIFYGCFRGSDGGAELLWWRLYEPKCLVFYYLALYRKFHDLFSIVLNPNSSITEIATCYGSNLK